MVVEIAYALDTQPVAEHPPSAPVATTGSNQNKPSDSERDDTVADRRFHGTDDDRIGAVYAGEHGIGVDVLIDAGLDQPDDS